MSSFRQYICNCKHIKKTMVSPGKNLYDQNLLRVFLSFVSEKRMSFFFSLKCKTCKAGMAVEAAMAVPFFFFFFMNILFSFDMLRLHGNLTGAMHQTGNKMAFYGYAYKSAAGEDAVITEEVDSLVLSAGYAGSRVRELLGKEYLDHTCLTSGSGGLYFIKSSVMERDDIIELVASYKVHPFAKIIGFPDFPMENRYYGRAWTGYDVENGQGGAAGADPVVFVTETGTVYHTARSCAYLNPSIKAVSAAAAGDLRNESGEKYYPCGGCGGSSFQPVVYITDQGNRIHMSLSCSGLKRTIYTIHLSEVGSRGKCSKCGG